MPITCPPKPSTLVLYQREAATGYFDAISEVVSQGQVRLSCGRQRRSERRRDRAAAGLLDTRLRLRLIHACPSLLRL